MIKFVLLLVPFVLVAVAVRADEKEEYEEEAIFAGGCFWCIEASFEFAEGVLSVESGYTGGKVPNPTYGQVTSGTTGHVEAVRVRYDKRKTTYEALLEIYWRQINPTDPDGQFADRGSQYRTAIFYLNEAQKRAAMRSLDSLKKSNRFAKPIATLVVPAGPFYPAEEYHQNYASNNPVRYKTYQCASGRAGFIEKNWKDAPPIIEQKYAKPDSTALRQKLTENQYTVTQDNGTEPPFNNAYWNHKEEGIYVDVVTGEPLFSSTDKFNSKTGWPSFTKPLVDSHIVEKQDTSHDMVRTEVRSRFGNSHLGHLFSDGPSPTGMRYCINSAALRFIPKADLEKEGYGEFKYLFD